MSSKITIGRSRQFFIFYFSVFLLRSVTGLADSSSTSNSKNETETASKKSSSRSIGLEILLICLGLLAAIAFAVFLFKLWQRKKREEQHARLLKLFEEDDELEVELDAPTFEVIHERFGKTEYMQFHFTNSRKE